MVSGQRLPGTSIIGFVGTPIGKADANTQETFGVYGSIYDIEDAKEDKSTVPIYYESRLAKLDINREKIDRLNKDVDEVIEDEEDVSARELTKGKWAELAKLVVRFRDGRWTKGRRNGWRRSLWGVGTILSPAWS